MDQYDQGAVRRELEPYHGRIREVVERGYREWLALKRLMTEKGYGPVLYPRTVANFVFDAVVRHALAEFGNDDDIRVVQDAQTVKFCIGDVVLLRFKKGDEDNLGRNHPTQAVMEFVRAQGVLPGLPPSAAKVEILYSATDIADGIDRVIVASRDGDVLLWSYELDDNRRAGGAIPFPPQIDPSHDDDGGDEGLVVPRRRKDVAADSEDD